MVRYLRYPTIEEEPPELAKLDDLPPVDFSVSAFDDFSLSFADSLMDFDWIEGPQVLDMADSKTGLEKLDSETTEVGAVACGLGIDKSCRETTRGDTHADGFQKLRNSGFLIEEEIRKVSLEGESDGLAVADANGGESPADGIGPMSGATGISGKSAEIVAMNENGANSVEMVSAETVTINRDGPKIDETESDGDESDSTSESDSTPSSSSSSSSSEEDDDEEEEEAGTEEQENLTEELEVEGEIDREEGEIRDSDVEKMVAWSGDEDDEEDGSGIKGPIRSKNELEALPFVPPVNVTLQPHHQTLPVGVILSTIGAQVIVEGVENHSPLSEGSILWITESRTPLGLVDEIFGPVKSPYYIIRYNSENEVPAGVKQGTSISFVPEFANHVLNDRNLYKKGYDASGENDEAISDEAEFSDDEKEAEYKRMLKMTKRGTNDPTLGKAKMDKKKFKRRGGTWQNSQPLTSQPVKGVHQIPTNQNQHCASPHAISMDRGNSSHSFGMSQGFAGNPQMVQAPGFIPPSSVVWTNGMPCEQQQRMVFPSRGVPSNGIPWPHPNFHQQSYEMPIPNIMPFQQQFLPNQIGPSNVVALPNAQSNFCAGPAFGPWAGSLGQSGYNQPFGMGLQCQQAPMSMNAPNVGASTQQPFGMGMPCQQAPVSMNACNAGAPTHPVISSNTEVPQGSYRGRGRKPYHRGGGGKFGGGRGRQSK